MARILVRGLALEKVCGTVRESSVFRNMGG